MMDSSVMVREILIEDYQGPALIWLQGCPWWWHQKEKLHSSVSQETLLHCHVSQKTALLMMMDSSVNERERDEARLIEDDQRAALIWHQDQKRHTWPASPGLLLMMQSTRRETLHSHHLYLSRETLSISLVEEHCPTVMLVRKLLCWWWWIVSLLSERNEVWVIEDCQRPAFDVTSRSETTRLTHHHINR